MERMLKGGFILAKGTGLGTSRHHVNRRVEFVVGSFRLMELARSCSETLSWLRM